jgi:6-phosphofructokinase 1
MEVGMGAMAEEMRGNLVVAQSGGPTAVINGSVVGVVHEALRHPCIEGVYGSLEGVGGILQEDLIDLRREDPGTINGLRQTPASALGTIRLKVRDHHLPRIVEVFRAHNVRFFFYIGGNDSQITSHDIETLATQEGWEMRVLGIPKTVDNDLRAGDRVHGAGCGVAHRRGAACQAARWRRPASGPPSGSGLPGPGLPGPR